MRKWPLFSLLAALVAPAIAQASTIQPPWPGECPPATQPSYNFTVPGVDNVPDLHGDPLHAELVLFIGGNQFMVLPDLLAAFERQHPELKGRVFYETLPPGILAKQMENGNAITIGCLTLRLQPDVYEAGAKKVAALVATGALRDPVRYATNDLTLMIAKGNPKHLHGLADLGRPGVRVAMPNPEWEGVARQIVDSYRKAGGEPLVNAIMKTKLAKGETELTQIHHRQTPLFILTGRADAGVTWQSEARYQELIGNPISHVTLPASQNTTAVYAAALVKGAPHAAAAKAWLAFLASPEAQRIYAHYGFKPVSHP